jgi:hypothetical protein
MDISRHWRLKTARGYLVATRRPTDGAVWLAQQGSAPPQNGELYRFEAVLTRPAARREEADYAKVAR